MSIKSPWHSEPGIEGRSAIIWPDRGPTAICVIPASCKNGLYREYRDAIVNAPLMLEALELALPHLDYEHVPDEVYFAVEDAIAKGRGTKP